MGDLSIANWQLVLGRNAVGGNPTNNIGARNIDKNGDYEAHIETQNYDCVNHQNHTCQGGKTLN